MRHSHETVLLTLLVGALAGLFGTLCMDVGGALLRRRGWIAGPPPDRVAKWFASLWHGRVSRGGLMAIHYAIGAGLGILGWVILPATGAPVAQLLEAILYGIATSVLAWFVMFPSMGYGVLGNRAPAKLKLFRSSLFNHVLYGAGLGTFGLILRSIP
jgi:hypothetical protein